MLALAVLFLAIMPPLTPVPASAQEPPSRDPALIRELLEGDPMGQLGTWVGLGYTAAALVETPGEFSRRGGIVDIWPPNLRRPLRIELFGDGIRVDNKYLSRNDLGNLGVRGGDSGFGVLGDIFSLAVTAKENYNTIKSEINEKRGNYPLAYPRGFDPYPQKGSSDYKDPYKKIGVI